MADDGRDTWIGVRNRPKHRLEPAGWPVDKKAAMKNVSHE